MIGTPGADRSFAFPHSRASAVINAMLGDAFRGVLSSDFSGGSNDTPGGKHQRCGVHLLRDVPALKAEHAGQIAVIAWADALSDLDLRARAVSGSPQVRQRAVATLSEEAVELGGRFAQSKGHPCQALAKRLLRHQGELFTFVVVASVAPDKNEAERVIRPFVITRKVRGGSRSQQGTQTRMTLASLVQTWLAQGLNPLDEVRRLFQSPLPQV
jgi:transposase